jgi:predicted transposase/invertase (TIGR01784 family)
MQKSSIEKAKREGREEGIMQEKLKIAQNLLDILDNETIAIKTGLSIEDIEALR